MFSFIKKLFDNKPSSIQNIEEPPKETESELTSYDDR